MHTKVGHALKALAVTGTVKTNVARIKMVPDISKFLSQLLEALALHIISFVEDHLGGTAHKL